MRVTSDEAQGRKFSEGDIERRPGTRQSQHQENTAARKQIMTSIRCYDDSHVKMTLLITNFHLCMIKLW